MCWCRRLVLTAIALLLLPSQSWENAAEAFVVRTRFLSSKRRRGVASAATADDEASKVTATTTTTTAGEEEEQEDEEAFSRAFPRYRIDLTPISKLDRPNNKNNNKLFSFWSKARLKSSLPSGATLEWRESEDGVTVLASLWRQAANLLNEQHEHEKETKTTLMSFPDAQPRVVQHWVDLFSWWNNHNNNNDDDVKYENPLEADQQGRLQVEYVNRENIPSVRFSLLSASSSLQPSDGSKTSPSRSWSHAVITKHTQAWVQRILVRQGICPFTKSTKTSGQGLADVGVPEARIAYHTSTACTICHLMADTWHAIAEMMNAGPTAVSSILLAAPHWDTCLADWTGPVFCLLEAGVVAAGAEADVGVVCFHPQYATPDGSTWPGFGHMHSVPRLQTWVRQQEEEVQEKVRAAKKAQQQQQQQQQQGVDDDDDEDDTTDPEQPTPLPLTTTQIAAGGAWQRRTPHATINVLRANQLAAAEGKRDSAALYYKNIHKLVGPAGIGLEQLQHDLKQEQRIE